MTQSNFRSLFWTNTLGVSALVLALALPMQVNAQQTDTPPKSDQQEIQDQDWQGDYGSDRGYGRHRGRGYGFHRGMGPGNGHGMMGRGFMHGFGPGMMMQKWQERFDTNGDGRIEKEEFSKAVRAEYDRYNVSKDDKLTKEQFENFWNDRHTEHRVRAFQFLDSNGDNSISKDEVKQLARRFSGFITRFDDRGIDLKDFQGRRGFGWHHKGWGMMGETVQDLLQEADLDKNAYVSDAEFETFLIGQFDKADTNKDGKLTQEEFAKVLNDFAKPMVVRAFQMFDANGDNVISFAEFNKHLETRFAFMDRNEDGVIEQKELSFGRFKGKGAGYYNKDGRYRGHRGKGHGWKRGGVDFE